MCQHQNKPVDIFYWRGYLASSINILGTTMTSDTVQLPYDVPSDTAVKMRCYVISEIERLGKYGLKQADGVDLSEVDEIVIVAAWVRPNEHHKICYRTVETNVSCAYDEVVVLSDIINQDLYDGEQLDWDTPDDRAAEIACAESIIAEVNSTGKAIMRVLCEPVWTICDGERHGSGRKSSHISNMLAKYIMCMGPAGCNDKYFLQGFEEYKAEAYEWVKGAEDLTNDDIATKLWGDARDRLENARSVAPDWFYRAWGRCDAAFRIAGRAGRLADGRREKERTPLLSAVHDGVKNLPLPQGDGTLHKYSFLRARGTVLRFLETLPHEKDDKVVKALAREKDTAYINYMGVSRCGDSAYALGLVYLYTYVLKEATTLAAAKA